MIQQEDASDSVMVGKYNDCTKTQKLNRSEIVKSISFTSETAAGTEKHEIKKPQSMDEIARAKTEPVEEISSSDFKSRSSRFNSMRRNVSLPATFRNSAIEVNHEELLAARKRIVPNRRTASTELSVIPVFAKSDETSKLLKSAIEKHFILSNLRRDCKHQLIEAMEIISVKEGSVIIEQNDYGDYFYVIENGDVEFIKDDFPVGAASSGSYFGELALLFQSPRAATCKASTDCVLYRICQETFSAIVRNNTQQKDNELNQLLINMPIFHGWEMSPSDIIAKLSVPDVLRNIHVKKGETIIRKGELGDTLYIIKSGSVDVVDFDVDEFSSMMNGNKRVGLGLKSMHSYVDHKLGKGDFFGGKALMDKPIFGATVVAIEDCTLLALKRDTHRVLFGPLESLQSRARYMSIITSIGTFANARLSSSEINAILRSVERKSFQNGEVFIGKAHEEGIYILEKGAAKISPADGDEIILTDGYFGDCTEETVTFLEETICAHIPSYIISRVLSGCRALDAPEKSERISMPSRPTFSSLKWRKQIGYGSFSKVYMVTSEDDNSCDTIPNKHQVFALKVMNKMDLYERKQIDQIRRERKIMSSFQHPFVLSLVDTFQDSNSVYMLLPHLAGGELQTIMKKTQLSDYAIKYYASCTIDALLHLHRRKIVHRDVKPENIVLSGEGHSVLIDFGVAKKMNSPRTLTLCGTPSFFAPELIFQQGYGKGVDYWAFGVLLYEMIVGKSPFRVTTNLMESFGRICKLNYSIPENKKGHLGMRLVKQLLVLETKRLGCLAGGGMDIARDFYFNDILWKDLRRKKMRPPYKPVIDDSIPSVDLKLRESSVSAKGYKKVPKEVDGSFLDFGDYFEDHTYPHSCICASRFWQLF